MGLQVENIHTQYGESEILRGVSLKIAEGELLCLLGANGAGKTTLLRTISGLVKPVKGSLHFRETRIDRLTPEEIVKVGISQCQEGRGIFPRMTVLKNLMLGAYVRIDGKNNILDTLKEVFDLFPLLKTRRKQLGGTLSGGEQQMLAIGRALMAKPKLLILDEPSMGLAPIVVEDIFKTIHKINNERGTTIFLVEQNASVSLNLAQRGYVMENGEITLDGSAGDLLHDEKVIESYLGL